MKLTKTEIEFIQHALYMMREHERAALRTLIDKRKPSDEDKRDYDRINKRINFSLGIDSKLSDGKD
jgi:hypothetical protein